ncbi:hypothetical protein P0D75_41510 [Paraburkholderia sediminicola]|uniref:hypothetical protein n=1 Tax=Paraburkholderia sediminicola TaxID=458836 RepID=UPI0038BA1690
MKLTRFALASFVVCAALAEQSIAAQSTDTRRSESSKSDPIEQLAQKLPNSMQYTLTDVEHNALVGVPYRVTFPSGITAQGVTDAQGRTVRFRTVRPERLTLAVKYPKAHVITAEQ